MNVRSEEAGDHRKERFIVKYCQRNQCLPEDFAMEVLRQCLRPGPEKKAPARGLFNAEFFRSARTWIPQVKDPATPAKARQSIQFFSKAPTPSASFMRWVLKVGRSRAGLLARAAAAPGERAERMVELNPA